MSGMETGRVTIEEAPSFSSSDVSKEPEVIVGTRKVKGGHCGGGEQDEKGERGNNRAQVI